VLLGKTEIEALDLQIARVHAATGVRVVAAEIGKADTYEDLPWKAFALGVALTALLVVGVGVLIPEWQTPLSTMLSAVIMLAAGALAALLAIFIPAFARLFLHGAQCEREVGQYAEAAVSAPRALQDPTSRRGSDLGEPLRAPRAYFGRHRAAAVDR